MITFTYIDKESVDHVLSLPDPEWITDYQKIHNVTVRRAMSGKIRTYVVRDRKYAHAITYSQRFMLHRSEVKACKKFLTLSDGHYIWAKGLDSNVSAQVAANANIGTRELKLKNVTGSINVGDYAEVDNKYYNIVGTSDSSITINPGLVSLIVIDDPVTIFKQQMVIVTNQDFSFGSDGRAAGDEDDPDHIGNLMNVEDETYTLTLALLVIKT